MSVNTVKECGPVKCVQLMSHHELDNPSSWPKPMLDAHLMLERYRENCVSRSCQGSSSISSRPNRKRKAR